MYNLYDLCRSRITKRKQILCPGWRSRWRNSSANAACWRARPRSYLSLSLSCCLLVPTHIHTYYPRTKLPSPSVVCSTVLSFISSLCVCVCVCVCQASVGLVRSRSSKKNLGLAGGPPLTENKKGRKKRAVSVSMAASQALEMQEQVTVPGTHASLSIYSFLSCSRSRYITCSVCIES